MRNSLVHLALFFAVGGVAYALHAERFTSISSREVLRVVVPADAAPADRALAVEEAILFDQARKGGWHRSDPVVVQHLVRSMQFVEGEATEGRSSSPETLLDKAIELGLDKRDPVVRARLIQRARVVLRALPESERPTEEMLAAHLRAHPDRFARPEAVRFSQVFVRRGEDASERIDRLLARLKSESIPVEEAYRLGDPRIGLRSVRTEKLDRLADRLGDDFVELVRKAALETWVGPVESSHGLHLVYVHERREPSPLPLEDVVNRVRADLEEEIARKRVKERLERIEDDYDIEWVER